MSALVAREIWSVAGLLDAFLLGAVLVILLGSRIKAWAAVEKVRGFVILCAWHSDRPVRLCRMR